MKFSQFVLPLLLSLPTQGLWSMQKPAPEPTSAPVNCPLECVENPIQRNLDGTINGYRPAFYPKEENCSFVTADFLYMQSSVDGFVYAWSFPQVLTNISNVRSNPIPGGTFHEVDYDWAPGFRLALGHHFFGMDHWDLELTWTYFKNHCTDDINDVTSIIGLWAPMGYLAGSFNAKQASADWRLNFNTLDLTLGRTSFAVKSIVINPFIGFRGAFVHQHFKAEYNNANFTNGTLPGSGVKFIGSNNFNGWGLRPGLETSWMINKTWSVYANTSVSALFGHFGIKENAYLTSSPFERLLNESDSYYRNAFAYDIALGLQWEKFFCPNRVSKKGHLVISAGYEMASWFAQNQMVNLVYIDQGPGFGPYLSGDLGLQGVDVSVRYDF